MKLQATYVSASEFDDQYFGLSFDAEDPGADLDLSAPMKPYLLIQRQFEDDDGGVCYIETHELDRYAGHFGLRLVEFAPTRLVFDIDRATDRRVEVNPLANDLGAGPGSATSGLYAEGRRERKALAAGAIGW